MNASPLTLDRSEIEDIARLAGAVLDDPNSPDEMRQHADHVYQSAHFQLCYVDN